MRPRTNELAAAFCYHPLTCFANQASLRWRPRHAQ